jgi:hypothetical protein
MLQVRRTLMLGYEAVSEQRHGVMHRTNLVMIKSLIIESSIIKAEGKSWEWRYVGREMVVRAQSNRRVGSSEKPRPRRSSKLARSNI